MKKFLFILSLTLTACGPKNSDGGAPGPVADPASPGAGNNGGSDKPTPITAPQAKLLGTWVQPLIQLALDADTKACPQEVLTVETAQLMYGEHSYDAIQGSCQNLTQTSAEPYYRLKYRIVAIQQLENGYADFKLQCLWAFYQCPTDEIHFAIKLEKDGEELNLVTRNSNSGTLDFSQPRIYTRLNGSL